MAAHMLQKYSIAMRIRAPGACLSPAQTCSRSLSVTPRAFLQHRTALPPRTAAATAGHLSTLSCSHGTGLSTCSIRPTYSAAAVSKHRCRRAAALPPLAMINVDFASPSLVLGITLIGCGIALLQVRNVQREVSRDADIVVAAMISIVGSTLIFQGWRLDPLLLLCQALTTSVAFWYGLETFKLRAQVTEEEESSISGQLPPPEGYNQSSQMPVDPYAQATRTGFLPPAADRQMPIPGMMQQQQPGMDAGSSRWGLPPAADQRYDYFGQPIGQQQPQQQQMYAGYDEQPRMYEQQQYAVPGELLGGYPGSLYGQQPQQLQQQQPQQPFAVPVNGTGVQDGWYGGAAGMGLDQQQQLGQYGVIPGVPGGPLDAAAGSVGRYDGLGMLPGGGAAAPGPGGADGYVAGGNMPLPLPPVAGQQQPLAGQQQQQQQRGSRSGPGAYERVDDWE